jgi:hypothetical protein
LDAKTPTDHADNPGLLGDMLRAPGKVAALKTESPEFDVSTTDTDGVDALCAELGVSGLTTELEFSFFAVVGALGTGFRALVP